jgi:hypothetical protein
VKPLFLLPLAATLAIAESHPSWWAYMSPEATAMVGIQWNNLRHSPFAASVEAKFSPSGGLGFPDLDCLRQAREIIISSPALLAAEAGSFPVATVKDQAQRQGFRRLAYRGVTLWLPQQAGKLGVAQISEQLILVGARETLQTAVDGGLSETDRQYSPLLMQTARFSQTGDVWVVAMKLPDPLADLFVPLHADGLEFRGQVSVHDGLALEASFDAGSKDAAADFARGLRERAPSFPAVARGVEVAADRSRVTLALQVSSEDLVAALQSAPAPVPVGPPEPAAVVASAAAPQLDTEPAQSPNPVLFEITHVEASQPQVIRILYLDEGTREIVLSPVPYVFHHLENNPTVALQASSEVTHVDASQSQVIRIFNLDEGTREIVPPVCACP